MSHKPVCGSLTSLVHTVLLMSGCGHSLACNTKSEGAQNKEGQAAMDVSSF